jgi:putative DNA primase/helicase
MSIPRVLEEAFKAFEDEDRAPPRGKTKRDGHRKHDGGGIRARGGGLPPTAEDSIALAFADRHAHALRYVAMWGRWLSYDGIRWSYDDTLKVFDRARTICREIATGGHKPMSAIASAKTVAAVERLARSDRRLAAKIEQWNASDWLLGTEAATVDLRAGIGRAADPLDYITKKTACACAPPGAPHPLWTAFLDRITDHDAELQGFLQRYVGYCLTGFTSEHVFVFAYGTGANGKSTFVNTVAGILGDYVAVADTATFIASNSERHPTELAKLLGARLVVAQETQKGRRWDETKIKALTGGDKMTARFMRQDFFDFTPTFKLFICGNHKPRLSSVDEAMRRRLLLVPFTVQIPRAERDRNLAEKLKAEWPAIFRWMLDGCLQWQRMGLAATQTVLDATDTYFADQDIIGQWLDECTEDGGELAHCRTKDLFASWKTWCEARNMKPGSERTLSEALADRGFAKGRNRAGQRGFRNLVVKA